MPNSSTGVEFITTALLLQNWLLAVRSFLSNEFKIYKIII
jgi:hypothetical protein